MSKSITVLIPAYNEENRITTTLAAIKHSKYITRIVVLDDGSTDNTFAAALSSGAEVYRLKENQGKGYALNYGLNKVADSSDIIVFLDADVGETAIEVDKLIDPIYNNEADVTIAKFPTSKKKGGLGLVKNLAKYGVKFYTGHTIYTSLSGQRAFKVEVLRKIGDIPSDYGIEVGMTIDIINMGFTIKEIEVNMTHRETGRDLQGFIHRGKQFYQILMTLIRKLRERR